MTSPILEFGLKEKHNLFFKKYFTGQGYQGGFSSQVNSFDINLELFKAGRIWQFYFIRLEIMMSGHLVIKYVSVKTELIL